jgi:antitoxin ParD1/3/4
MPMVRKSITVTGHQEAWIQAQMASGNYGTDSELIREALREKQARSENLESLKILLKQGENSGRVTVKPKNEMLSDTKKRLKKLGKL